MGLGGLKEEGIRVTIGDFEQTKRFVEKMRGFIGGADETAGRLVSM